MTSDSTSKSPVETIFDHAIEANGFIPRGEGESISDYVDRDDWGPNTRENLKRAAEASARIDRTVATTAIASARDHHDDPNPPDSKPRKK